MPPQIEKVRYPIGQMICNKSMSGEKGWRTRCIKWTSFRPWFDQMDILNNWRNMCIREYHVISANFKCQDGAVHFHILVRCTLKHTGVRWHGARSQGSTTGMQRVSSYCRPGRGQLGLDSPHNRWGKGSERGWTGIKPPTCPCTLNPMPGGLLTFQGRAGARRRGRTDQFSILLAQSCQLLLWGAQRVQCLHQQCDLLPCKAQEAKACTLFFGDLPRPRSTLLGLEAALHNYTLYRWLN